MGGDMQENRSSDLSRRTKHFALDVIHFVESLAKDRTNEVIGRQLLRAATSVGANYRAATHARSRADFISKMGIVEEEADECVYWFEILEEAHKTLNGTIEPLKREARELLAITITSIKTAKRNRNR